MLLLLFSRAKIAVETTAAVSARGRVATAATRASSTTIAVRGSTRAATTVTRAAQTTALVHGRARVAAPAIRASATAVSAWLLPRGDVVFEAVQYQTAAAVADLADGSWTNELGSATNLFASLDEALPSDADYIQSSLSPLVVDECRVILASLEDPGTSSNHVLRYRFAKDETAGDQIDLVVRLYAADGTTVIAEQIHLDIDALTDGELVLSGAEAGAIDSADYSTGLVVGFRAVKA